MFVTVKMLLVLCSVSGYAWYLSFKEYFVLLYILVTGATPVHEPVDVEAQNTAVDEITDATTHEDVETAKGTLDTKTGLFRSILVLPDKCKINKLSVNRSSNGNRYLAI